MLNGLGIFDVIEVVAPTVSANDTLTVSLTDDYGYTADQVAAFRGARILGKQVTAGTGQVLDDSVAIDGTDLVITEGSTGFADGDVFQVGLFVSLATATATASTA